MPLLNRVNLLCKTEITQLDLSLCRYQNVTSLNIAMQEVVLVKVGQTFKDLLQDALELTWSPLKFVVNQSRQIVRDKLEN